MRLILVDRLSPKRRNFHPLVLSRPLWELRCGMTSLADKLVARLKPAEVACFLPPYLAEVYRAGTPWRVNDPQTLTGDDLMVVDPRVKAAGFPLDAAGPSQVAVDADGELLCARVCRSDLPRLQTDSIEALLDSLRRQLPQAPGPAPPTWNYVWDLVLANPQQLAEDFRAAGRSGVEGAIEQPAGLRGSRDDIYVAPGAVIHPLVVLDAEHGPIYIDQGAEIHPFTRVEGPCYVGRNSILLGAKCREGNSIGPMCRVGGEVEESIIQGYSNKYHDGFLGHAYVGQWVNLGALTTNSDLKNDYSSVSVVLDGRTPVSTGSTKVGSLIGDHAKTSIGTLLNTGSYVGAMTVLMATGKPLPKFIPSFAWFMEGAVGKGFGKSQLFATAKIAMGRRKCQWTAADQALWETVFQMTAPERDEAIARSRRQQILRTR
jgi:UDP-N-acetylglucosamine diphosphorylase/glucosamine-1-phosphate N-acetyltransferase